MKKFLIILFLLLFTISCYSQNFSFKVTHYANGKKMELFSYKNKILDGKYFFWDIDGYLLISGNYICGMKDGKWLYYWKSKVKEECWFKNDTIVNCNKKLN